MTERSSRRVVRASGFLPAVLLGTLLAVAAGVSGQTVDVTYNGRTFELRYTALFSPDMLAFGKLLGYDTIGLPDGGALCEPGKPMLPTALVRIALPDGMRVTGVRVVAAEAAPLAGEYLVFPAQPPRRPTWMRSTIRSRGHP